MQAEAVDLSGHATEALWQLVQETEGALIPDGLHIMGKTPDAAKRAEFLDLMEFDTERDRQVAEAHLGSDAELTGLMTALSARYVAPVAGGDIIRAPQILPTGRNIHAFDPFRMPTAYAMADGARQAEAFWPRMTACRGASRWSFGDPTASSPTADRSRRRSA